MWEQVVKSHIFESSCRSWNRCFPNLPYFCIYGSSGWASVMVSPGSLTKRRIWDTAGYKRVSHAFGGMCV